jgi:hypothetical protein
MENVAIHCRGDRIPLLAWLSCAVCSKLAYLWWIRCGRAVKMREANAIFLPSTSLKHPLDNRVTYNSRTCWMYLANRVAWQRYPRFCCEVGVVVFRSRWWPCGAYPLVRPAPCFLRGVAFSTATPLPHHHMTTSIPPTIVGRNRDESPSLCN